MVRTFRYCRPRREPEETLPAYLAKKFTYLTQEEWGKHIAAGHVGINGTTWKDASYVLQQGDHLRFAPPRSLEPAVDEEHLEVIYEDEALVVVAKNGNLPVAEGGRYCENTLVALLRRRGTAAFHTPSTVKGVSACLPQNTTTSAASSAQRDDAEGRVGGRTPETDSPVTACQGSSSAATALSPPARRSRDVNTSQAHAASSRMEATPCESSTSCNAEPPLSLFTVHRLDKETSGIVALGKSSAAAKALASQLEEQTRGCTEVVEALLRERGPGVAFTSGDFDTLLSLKAQAVHKTYTAVLRGAARVGQTYVVVNYMDCMARHPHHATAPAHAQLKKLKMCCEPLEQASLTAADGSHEVPSLVGDGVGNVHWGKVAATRLRVLASDAHLDLTVVEVELLTGRSHQIRVHCAAIGYPVLGDKLYTTVTPRQAGGAVAVPDEVYLERVRREDDPFVEVETSDFGFCGDGGNNVESEGGTRGRLWCRRHLLHATQLRFPHQRGLAPAAAMTFVASPVAFFVADVRFERLADASRFKAWLSTAAVESVPHANGCGNAA